jgi:hypothetical protein
MASMVSSSERRRPNQSRVSPLRQGSPFASRHHLRSAPAGDSLLDTLDSVQISKGPVSNHSLRGIGSVHRYPTSPTLSGMIE